MCRSNRILRRMKTGLVLWSVFALAATALGQGQFVFNNRALPDINARFVLENGVVPGSDSLSYTVQLFGGPTGSLQSTWTELGTTTFRTGNAAGYVNPITVTVPGATTAADLFVRIYTGTTTGGSTYYSPSWGRPEQAFTVPVAVAPNPPPNLQLGTSTFVFFPYIIPEPSTCALMVVGMLAILFRSSKPPSMKEGSRKDRRLVDVSTGV
jgi:hypothetical protein